IRSKQRSDGSWANFYDGPADLSTTLEAYVALRLAGDEPTAAHMSKAASFVQESGGLEHSRVFTRLWMALFGLWSWDDLPALPPEVIFLPAWFPLNIYDFACWARQTVVALTVVAAYRPVRPLGVSIEELRSGREPKARGSWSKKGAFVALDKMLHRYEALARHPLVKRTIREAALAAGEAWIVRHQEADGSWGGIQPPWVYSLMALSLRGYGVDHPVMRKGLEGIEAFTIEEGGTRRLEACQSPVWDTALALTALCDAGVDPDEPGIVRAVGWVLDEEVTARGDWSVRRPHLEPGGWAFELENDNYPDIDDTAEVVLALRKALGSATRGKDAVGERAVGERAVGERACAAMGRGRAWVEGMASKDGGWAAFDADNTRELVKSLPFCDFGAVIDPPSADVTAHVVEMLACERAAGELIGAPGGNDLIEGGLDWLTKSQEPDGSWFGRWGANYVYGTGAAVPALVAAGVDPSDARIRRAVSFLDGHQNEDGGFGEDLRSYKTADFAGRGSSTPSQTAWALLALVAAGEAGGDSARRAVGYLVESQRPDGGWDEPFYTGTGFPGDFYINYHLYRLVFPV
ncbi:MAG: squalene--hopene cyclase, partial [Acidimicrobiales bacterium]